MVFKKRLVKIVYLMYTNYCMFNVVSYYSIDLIYCFNSIFNVHTDFRFWIPVAGLSVRAGGRGFSPATKRVAPGYFHRKIQQKEKQKKSLAV